MSDYPPCFNSKEEWDKWEEMEHAARSIGYGKGRGGKKISFCADCTPEYAEKMRKQGRCVNPNYNFKDGQPVSIHSSGVRGVIYDSTTKKWTVTKCKDSKKVWLGSYSDLDTAIAVLRKYESDGIKPTGNAKEGVLLRDNRKVCKAW